MRWRSASNHAARGIRVLEKACKTPTTQGRLAKPLASIQLGDKEEHKSTPTREADQGLARPSSCCRWEETPSPQPDKEQRVGDLRSLSHKQDVSIKSLFSEKPVDEGAERGQEPEGM